MLSAGSVVAQGDVSSLRLGRVRHVRASIVGNDTDIGAELAAIAGTTDIMVDVVGDSIRIAATIDGDIDPFVRLLARHRVHDLHVEAPDLEESVLQLYGSANDGNVMEVRHA